eukprot:gene8636-64700_t
MLALSVDCWAGWYAVTRRAEPYNDLPWQHVIPPGTWPCARVCGPDPDGLRSC